MLWFNISDRPVAPLHYAGPVRGAFLVRNFMWGSQNKWNWNELDTKSPIGDSVNISKIQRNPYSDILPFGLFFYQHPIPSASESFEKEAVNKLQRRPSTWDMGLEPKIHGFSGEMIQSGDIYLKYS